MTHRGIVDREDMEVVVFTVRKALWLATLLLAAGAAAVIVGVGVMYATYSVLIALA